MTFTSWLKNKKKNFTDDEFSELLGIPSNEIVGLLNGNILPNTEDIINIWIAFKLNHNELLELISLVADAKETSFRLLFNELIIIIVNITENNHTIKLNRKNME